MVPLHQRDLLQEADSRGVVKVLPGGPEVWPNSPPAHALRTEGSGVAADINNPLMTLSVL